MTKSLDLGCGQHLQNPFGATEVVGLDVRADLPGNVVQADLIVDALPFADASLDYVTAFDILQYLPRVVYAPQRRYPLVELMNEVFRVLKPGATFAALTPAAPHTTALADPAQVQPITADTFALYFDARSRLAQASGFRGAFEVVNQEWQGPKLYSVLRKAVVQERNRLISVLIPVYNGAALLPQTLDSVLAQTLPDFEVLCVDDGSQDDSLQILQRYAAQDTRIRVLQTPRNLGTVSKVMNFTLPHMRGAYCVYSSQDDVFSPDWLQKMRERAEQTGADAVIPDLVFYYAQDPVRNRTFSGLRGNRAVELSNREAVHYSVDWTIPGNALWNADLIRKLGFADFGMNADEYSARVFFMHCNKVVFSEGQFFYRQDNDQAVTKKMSERTFDYPYTQLRVYQLLRENGFAAEQVQAAALQVVDQMRRLRLWLQQNPHTFSVDATARAQARLQTCYDQMRDDPMFAQVLPVIEPVVEPAI
jgi:SAM-dependent methyltransferase